MGQIVRSLKPRLDGGPKRKKIIQGLWLKAFANSGNVRAACEAAPCSRAQIYRWLERDPKFAARKMEAWEEFLDALRAEASVRAKTSDTMLLARLRAYLREYKETIRNEHTVPPEQAQAPGGGAFKFTLELSGGAPAVTVGESGMAAPEEDPEAQAEIERRTALGETNGSAH